MLPATSADAAALDRVLARADAYRVLAAIFRDPDGPADDDGAGDLGILRECAAAAGVDVPPDRWDELALIAERAPRAAEHRATFGHVVAHGCPPYETEYGRRHLFGQSQDLGDIRGFYEAFGVRPRRGGERPDHVACELEFLALLALKEAYATASGDDERTAIVVAATGRFLADHLGRWLPAFAARIAARSPGAGYAAAAAIAAAVVGTHADELGVAPTILAADDLVPVEGEPDGFAFECGIDPEAGDLAPPDPAP